jgi:hypothetical protein
MLNILIPMMLAIQPADTTKIYIGNVSNSTKIEKIDGRDLTFGVKEEVEEILNNQGYFITDSTGFAVQVSITKLESPQQILNIVGLKWLRKDYVVETEICMGSGCFTGSSMRRTFIFAALLDVQNNEVPLNRKSFSKALQSSLKDAATFKHKKSSE